MNVLSSKFRSVVWTWIVVAAGITGGVAVYVYSQSATRVGYALVTAGPGQQVPEGFATISQSNPEGILVSQTVTSARASLRAGRIYITGTESRTALVFVNPHAIRSSLRLILRDDSGKEVDRKSFVLEAGRQLTGYVVELLPASQLLKGSVTFDSDQPVGVLAVRERFNSHGELIYVAVPVVGLELESRPAPVVPLVTVGDGYTSELVLMNRESRVINGRIRVAGSDGQPLAVRINGEMASEISYRIAPDGIFRIQFDEVSAPAGAYLTMAVPDGEAIPSAILTVRLSDNGRVTAESLFEPPLLVTSARFFVSTAGTETRIAIANPNEEAAQIAFDLVDGQGIVALQTAQVLPAHGSAVIGAADLFPSLQLGFAGQIAIRSNIPVAAAAYKRTINSRRVPLIAAQPLADSTSAPSAGPLVFPFLLSGSGFETKIVLTNPNSGIPAGGLLSVFTADGAPMPIHLAAAVGAVFPYQIGSGGSRLFFPERAARISRVSIRDPKSNQPLSELTVSAGSSIHPRIVVEDEMGEFRDDFDIGYTSINPAVAAIDAFGTIQGSAPGFSTLTVTAGGVLATATITVVQVDSGIGAFDLTGIVQDMDRRFYVTATSEHTILLAEGFARAASLFAGTFRVPGLKDDIRRQAQFKGPTYLTINRSDGSLFVSDTDNHVIRRVEPGNDGRVGTVAGTGFAGASDGPLPDSSFDHPEGIALDKTGHLWIADSGNHAIRRINLVTRQVETIAGTAGAAGLADGMGNEARFKSPSGITIESESTAEQLERERTGQPAPPIRAIVADTGNGVIRRVIEDGTVETIRPAMLNPQRLPLASEAKLALSENPVNTPVSFRAPTGVAVDAVGNIYVTDPSARQLQIILRTGDIVTASEENTFTNPRGIVIQDDGRVLVTDGTRAIRQLAYGPPQIVNITPGRVRIRGGERVVINGHNFAPDSLVVVGGTVVREVTVVDTETIVFIAPILPSGLTTLTVQNRGGLAQAGFLVEPIPLNELMLGQITTLAGGAVFNGDGAPAVVASIASPEQVAVDTAGNVFIADAGNHRIRRIDAVSGLITTFAGNGRPGFTGDGGPAIAASFNSPAGIAFDNSGNLFIADTGNSRIRKVNPGNRRIETIAGGVIGFSGDNGPATAARLNAPRGLVTDSSGNLYIADSTNHRIRKIGRSGIITTIAGDGTPRFNGDNLPALNTSLNSPRGVTLTGSGELLIADTFNHRIRKVDFSGIMRTVAGNGIPGFSGDRQSGVSAQLNFPGGVAVDASGTLFIADTGNNRIRRVDISGEISTIAGNGVFGFYGDGAAALYSVLANPRSIAVTGSGTLLVADAGNNSIRKIADEEDPVPTIFRRRIPIITTIAGTGQRSFQDQSGLAAAANLRTPSGVAVDTAGNLYIADSGNHRVLKADAIGHVITIVAGIGESGFSGDGGPAAGAALSFPAGLAIDAAGNLYIADNRNHRVRRVDTHGIITTVAGNGLAGFSGDGGAAISSSLAFPLTVTADARGTLLIADTGNHRVRRVDALTGIITTVAGNGDAGFSGDGGPATTASLNSPRDVAADSNGHIYIADSSNDRIRKIDFRSGIITTLAGNGIRGFNGDGGPASAASLGFPVAIEVNQAGEVFIADILNRRIRKVDAQTGRITTLAGNGLEGLSGDGGPAIDAVLSGPAALIIDSAGNPVFIDGERVRALLLTPSP
jgi:sugar lactone lactonase YvrE